MRFNGDDPRAVVYRQYVRFGCVKTGFDSRQPDEKQRDFRASGGPSVFLLAARVSNGGARIFSRKLRSHLKYNRKISGGIFERKPSDSTKEYLLLLRGEPDGLQPKIPPRADRIIFEMRSSEPVPRPHPRDGADASRGRFQAARRNGTMEN
jgi:hypothetical protein